MHIDEGELRQTLVDASFEVSSLDASRSGDEEGYSLLATLQAPAQTEPGSHHDNEELVRELGRALGRLPERQRLLLSLYYVEELTMKEVGEALGISESRVSQLHGQAITALRGLLQAAGYLKREPNDPGGTPSPDKRGPATRSPAPHEEHRPAPAYEAMVSVSERRYGRHTWEV
jgi:DNA-directed RNA polymerase sigma subunit (sigma70/sigma32)